MHSSGSERGAAAPVVVLAVTMAIVMVMLLVGISERVLDRSRAQHAADAAALAGAIEGREGAVDLANLNGGELVVFEESGGVVRVVVEVNGRRAEARAEKRLSSDPGG